MTEIHAKLASESSGKSLLIELKKTDQIKRKDISKGLWPSGPGAKPLFHDLSNFLFRNGCDVSLKFGEVGCCLKKCREKKGHSG